MKKRFLLLLVAVMFVLASVALVACGGDERGDSKHKISVTSTAGGSVSVSAGRADADTEITVTLRPDSGFEVGEVTVGDKKQTVENNTVKFKMPDSDVKVSVTFVKIKYALNFTQGEGGEIVSESDRYESGTSVTLTVKPYYGYELINLFVDGNDVDVTDGTYTFVMPEKEVSVTSVFLGVADTVELPKNSMLTLKATAPLGGGTAVSDTFVTFGENDVILKTYVTDLRVVEKKDGMRFYFGTSDFASGKVSAANIAVEAYVNGSVTVSKGDTGAYVATSDTTGITTDFEPWSVVGGKINGYIYTLKVSFDVLGLTEENAAEKLTALVYLVNNDSLAASAPSTVATIDDYYNYGNPDTYQSVSATGFSDNRYMFGKGAVGSYKNVVNKGTYWNVSKDYEQDDPENNYAEREITLDGHDDKDNNIAFIKTGGRTSFVKAKFKINAVHNTSEQHAKFGLMLFDASVQESGVFFYVSADANKSSGVTVDDITGTALGYNSRKSGSWGNWTDLSNTEGSLDLTSKEITLGLAYNNGLVFMYHCTEEGDRLVGVTTYKTSGNIVIGMKCFGLGLKVTDYVYTNNANDSLFQDHSSREDGTTVGDNASGYAYTEGWSIVGDLAENTGSGDQKIFVKDVLESAELYAQVNVTTPGKVDGATDEFTKVGMILQNDTYMVFGYIDLADSTDADKRIQTNFALQHVNGNRWEWEVGMSGSATTVEDKEITIGIAKLGANVYLLVNGNIVSTYSNSNIASQKFVAGVLGFNRHMLVTKGSGSTDEKFIRDKLGLTIPEGVKLDGVLDDEIWTESVLENTQTFAKVTKNGTRIEVAAVKGESGVYVAVMMYTKTEQQKFSENVTWNSVTNVAFRFVTMTDDNRTDAGLAQYIAMYNGLNGGIRSSFGIVGAASKSEQTVLVKGEEGKDDIVGYKTTVEFFVPYRYFEGNAEAAELPFYVWTCKYDGGDYGAMNSTYKSKIMVVTENGLVLKDK